MVGILGGFTTFSSFGLESFLLFKQGAMGLALLYALSSVIIGIIVLALGFYLTSLVLAQS